MPKAWIAFILSPHVSFDHQRSDQVNCIPRWVCARLCVSPSSFRHGFFLHLTWKRLGNPHILSISVPFPLPSLRTFRRRFGRMFLGMGWPSFSWRLEAALLPELVETSVSENFTCFSMLSCFPFGAFFVTQHPRFGSPILPSLHPPLGTGASHFHGTVLFIAVPTAFPPTSVYSFLADTNHSEDWRPSGGSLRPGIDTLLPCEFLARWLT
eukprot:RCo015364